MNKKIRLTFLFLFGIVLAFFTLYLGFVSQGWFFKPKTKPESFVFKPPLYSLKTTIALISFDPKELTIRQNEELKIEVFMESETKIIGADLNFKFDPRILEVKQVKPGGFFSKPQEIKKIINNQKGKIFYSLGSFKPQSGKGQLAELIFKPKRVGTSELSLTAETQIAAEGIDEAKVNLPVLGKYTIVEIRK